MTKKMFILLLTLAIPAQASWFDTNWLDNCLNFNMELSSSPLKNPWVQNIATGVICFGLAVKLSHIRTRERLVSKSNQEYNNLCSAQKELNSKYQALGLIFKQEYPGLKDASLVKHDLSIIELRDQKEIND